ncbi:exostosin-1a-like protein [Dermatophagoides farinae]|uniref:Exostosin-1a-like protein n=1 Tax=Dermatophagoides farinae TaxID=6954 RepID=A0A9D4SEE9_DERFA|nr:exostosin-1a-like protein [Dermatophagoides farinae]
MDSDCFDFNRCPHGDDIRIYIYPHDSEHTSVLFRKIVTFIKQSKYYESDPNKACLFISNMDTLDRDRRSYNFHKYSIESSIDKLLLHEGRNHLMFNLYSGSWPDYVELDFSGIEYPKYAILIKASMSYENYRPGFDVSFPLFMENHPDRGPQQQQQQQQQFQNHLKSTKYLMVFKGKRYTYGIGGETRNSLYHLHNGNDIHIYTTCKHGKKWKEFVDERCDQDNAEYDKHDYQIMMKNSTFCLVPRGRRLGSYRFLEALSFGCIPIVLSNSWVLPFSEIIDWPSAVVMGDERLVFQIPDHIRSLSRFEIESMRLQGIFLYNNYFSSINRILMTTISIIEDRINTHWCHETFQWNVANKSPLTPLWIDQRYNNMIESFPQYGSMMIDKHGARGFTAIIAVSRVISYYQLNKFLRASLLSSKFVRRILILWSLRTAVFKQLLHLQSTHPSLILIEISSTNNNEQQSSMNSNRFTCCFNHTAVTTDAIFHFDPESNLITEEIDFAYLVWESFSERLIGFSARDHYFDNAKNQWTYTSKWTNQYSIILFDAVIYHKYYNYLYYEHIYLKNINSTWNFDEECSGLAFNFLISHIIRESPLKVTQRKKTISGGTLFDSWLAWIDRKSCFQKLIKFYGYIPLIKSKIRFEPLLYKDVVSSMRKKYRKLEMIV